MICAPCAAAADLKTAARQDDPDHPLRLADRVGDVVGRPFVATLIIRAVRALHTTCRGCDCQHQNSEVAR